MTQFERRIALGLSAKAFPLLETIGAMGLVDQLALPPGVASSLEDLPEHLLIDSPSAILSKYWFQDGVIIVVGAIGAVVRLIAPNLTNKNEDPAVVVLDAQGHNVVPLLGGHKAGGNSLALELANAIGAHSVLTGYSSSQELIALDAFGEAWGWKRAGNENSWKSLMIAQAHGQTLHAQQSSGSTLWRTSKGARDIFFDYQQGNFETVNTLFIGSQTTGSCRWHPSNLWVGIGCERNTNRSLIQRSLHEFLEEHHLAKEALAGFATIDLKSNEEGLISYAKDVELPIRFFSAQQLLKIDVPNPSQLVKAEVGTYSVSEAAAILASASKGVLQEKRIYKARSESCEKGAVTLSVAEAELPFAPHKGEIHLIGSGPGQISFLTNDARRALSRSVVWCGYKPYLDLLDSFKRPDQVRVDSQLTQEKERCSLALDLAAQGIRVSLISSGESGIYGMAGLALELWLARPKEERPSFQIHPGISAMQMAAARIGSPLMNDFCTISLSDCLTPWEKIQQRIKGAAEGDFVLAIYNPRSTKRDWQLKKTINILKQYRSSNTPVVLARQLGRSGEDVSCFTLDTLPIEKVDMLSFLFIGNSSSYLDSGWFVSPRGY